MVLSYLAFSAVQSVVRNWAWLELSCSALLAIVWGECVYFRGSPFFIGLFAWCVTPINVSEHAFCCSKLPVVLQAALRAMSSYAHTQASHQEICI